MSGKSKALTHWATYIEYTGWYALCRADKPELDHLPARLTRAAEKVTCPDCKKEIR